MKDYETTIALIREGKSPPDARVALSPAQAAEVQHRFPNTKLVVQNSDIRAFSDESYANMGLEVREDISDAHILLGVKEVPIEDLISGKTYLFFSHTWKKQPYNRKLLKAILEKQITLIDYELITRPGGARVIGFGRYAGVVGAYNGLLGWGKLTGSYQLKPAHACADRKEVEQELSKVNLPPSFKLVITGKGRVGKGAREILSHLSITEVSPEVYLSGSFDTPVFTHLDVQDYNIHKDGRPFEKEHFYKNPEAYNGAFLQYAKVSDMYMACHFWGEGAPAFYTAEAIRDDSFRIAMVADISADIGGPIATTLRPSTIEAPFYGVDRKTGKEVPFGTEGAVGVMAIDNLPCELPKDASEDFGRELIEEVLPALLVNDVDARIARATESNAQGQLTDRYAYLQSWLDGTDA